MSVQVAKTRTRPGLGRSLIERSIGMVTSIAPIKQAEPTSSRYQQEMERTPFQIFRCLEDLGYYSWNPQPSRTGYKSISRVRSGGEIRAQIDYSGRPDALVSFDAGDFPKRFAKGLTPQRYPNQYPNGQFDVAGLHVAFQHRAVKDIDFCFGGSTLDFLATQAATQQDGLSSNYVATKLPGTETILVVKHKFYITDYATIGFQFERLMTGGQCFDPTPDLGSVEHLHVMEVGEHRILFQAEVDAVYQDEPVELKASHPGHFGTKVMFQMISSGSPFLCHSVRRGLTVEGVRLESLEHIAKEAVDSTSVTVTTLEERILQGLADLREQMKGCCPGVIFKVDYVNGRLRLSDSPNTSVLPPEEVVKELIL